MTPEELTKILTAMETGKANRKRKLENAFDRLDLVLAKLYSSNDPKWILDSISRAIVAERKTLIG